MTGEFQYHLDAKGRLFVPARLREELGENFYLTVSPEPCLSVYSGEGWRELTDKVRAMPYGKQRRLRPLFASAVCCALDGQGRILLPRSLRDYARLHKSVTVVGCGSHAELWDSGEWAARSGRETTPENLAAMMEELDF